MSQLLKLWSEISSNSAKVERLLPDQQANLLRSLQGLDKEQLQRIRSSPRQNKRAKSLLAAREALELSDHFIKRGQRELALERVGIVIFAGGQGSRLGKGQPKGMYPLSSVKQRSLFQIFAEAISVAQKNYGQSFPLAVMTSLATHSRIESFFQEHRFWGLNPKDVYFFPQGELPLLDATEDPWLTADGNIRTAPNGNGGAFRALHESSIMQKLHEQKIEYLMMLPIDNALADPLNAGLIGAVATLKKEEGRGDDHCVCFKAVKRTDPKEKTGLFVLEEGKLRVSEYVEHEQNHQDQLPLMMTESFGLANTGEFCISMNFANFLGQLPLAKWPLHVVKKNVVAHGGTREDRVFSLKAEYFNFDLLQWAHEPRIMKFDRFSTFAPLKDADGPRGPTSVEEILLRVNQKSAK